LFKKLPEKKEKEVEYEILRNKFLTRFY